MTLFRHMVIGQTVVGSFYNHANFNAVTKPQSTFHRLAHTNISHIPCFIGLRAQITI